jgi:hypothetical protein
MRAGSSTDRCPAGCQEKSQARTRFGKDLWHELRANAETRLGLSRAARLNSAREESKRVSSALPE